MLGYVLIFFMPNALPTFLTKRGNRKSPFGPAGKWPADQLPTRRDIIQFYLYKRAEMEENWKTVPLSLA